MSHLSQRPADPVVGESHHHESAFGHVTGAALYTDDLVGRLTGVLHAYPVQSEHAHASLDRVDAAPAYAVPGVVRVITATDVPGVNDQGVKHDEPMPPTDEVMFFGQPVAWVLGEDLEAAKAGAAAVVVDATPRPRSSPCAMRSPPALPRGPAGHRQGRRRRRLRRRRARLLRRIRIRRAGALLPRDPGLARPRRRVRPGLHPVLDPAPHGDPGHRLPRPRDPRQRGHRPVPADGGGFGGKEIATTGTRRSPPSARSSPVGPSGRG